MSGAERVARHYFLRPRPNDVPAIQTLKAELARLREKLGVRAGKIRKLEAQLLLARRKLRARQKPVRELEAKLALANRRARAFRRK